MYNDNKWNDYGDKREGRQDYTPEPAPETSSVNFTMRNPENEEELNQQNQQGQQYQQNQQSQQKLHYNTDGNYSNHYNTGADYGRNTYEGACSQAYYNQGNFVEAPLEPAKQGRKKSSLTGRIAGITAAAILFGAVAGGTMVGVNSAFNYFKGDDYPSLGTTETFEDSQAASKPTEDNTSDSASASTETNNTIATVISGDVSTIVDAAMPSVVAINNTVLYQNNTFFGSQTYKVPASGSGIIVGQNETELLIVTNNHVVQDSMELQVSFIDNTSVDAAIKGTDSDSDLAIIAVPLESIPAETLSKIKLANLGDSDSLKVGQGVVAIGNALGYGQSVTVGYVSALDREVTTEGITRTLLQTDAAINPGNSGGALLNMKGEVIGINAAKYSSTEVEGMGYAIPISYAQEIITDLMNRTTRVEVPEDQQGYLGIQLQNIDRSMSDAFGMPQGIYVYKILEDSAASSSDLRERDIITKIDGETVKNGEDLEKMLTYYKAGTKVTLTVQSLSNGAYEERQVEVTLGSRPDNAVINN